MQASRTGITNAKPRLTRQRRRSAVGLGLQEQATDFCTFGRPVAIKHVHKRTSCLEQCDVSSLAAPSGSVTSLPAGPQTWWQQASCAPCDRAVA